MVASKGIMDHLIMAACEWFLIFWMFIEALLSYSLTKFASYCQLQIPCLLCSRLDHLFGNEESGPCSYVYMFCKKHQTDVSCLIYCNLHDELVDAREMCDDCSNSASYRYNNNNKSFVCDPCSCCKSSWKEKSTSQPRVWGNVVGSRVSKATTKPPLPRVGRHGRSKRVKNKVKHRHNRNALSPVGQYPSVKFTSDSELEFLFSDNDDGGGYKVVGVSERSLRNEPNILNQYKALGRNAHSSPDLRSAFLLEAHLNECSRTKSRARSASLTPDCLIMHNLEELSRKEFDPLRIGKYKNSSSSMNTKTHGSGHGSLDGSMYSGNNNDSKNRYNVFSRNSYSASDLGSAVRLEMQHNNNRLRQRSASLTPNMLCNYSLEKQNKQKTAHPKVKKHKKVSSNNDYGYSDDSVVSCNTGDHHSNRNMIPRRHSYSVFQLGGEILLNMPTDESQNGQICYSLEDFRKSNPRSPEPDFINMMQFEQKDDEYYTPTSLPPIAFIRSDLPIAFIDRNNKWYGSLDDSAVMRNTGLQYKDNTPRRHSHSFFDLGCEILLNMPVNESLEQPRNLNIQNMPNPSADPVQVPCRRKKRNKRSLSSSNRTSGYESLDDLIIPFDSGFHEQNMDPRRHSYSAFELGDALMLNTQSIDKCLADRSASVTQNMSGFQTMPNSSQSTVFFNKNQGYGFLDDSVVSRTGIDNHNHYQNHHKIPRRHSYSILQLGGDIILNMPHDEILTSQSFGEPQKSTFENAEKEMNSLPPTGLVRRFSLPNDVISDLSIDKTKWHGSFDDYLIIRSQSQSDTGRRHSHSAFDLGRALLLEINLDNSLRNGSTGYGSNRHGSTGHGSTGHGSTEHHRAHHRAKRNNSQLPPPCPMNHPLGSSSDNRHEIPTFTFDTTHGIPSFDESFFSQKSGNSNNIQYDNSNPRRHSYTAFELGCALLLNMNRDATATSTTRRSASVTPKIQIVNESQLPNFKKDEQQPLVSLHKPHGYKSCDESGVSNNNNNKDGRKRSKNLTRNYFSVSDLTSLNLDEGSTRKSASLTPDCILGQGFGDLNSLKFQSGSTSSHQKRKKNDRLKPKSSKRKGKKHKKPLRTTTTTTTTVNNVNIQSSSTNANLSDASYESFDDSDTYESFDDSDTETQNENENQNQNQNRYKIFSRNAQSASDLAILEETQSDNERSRNRSKSLTPNYSYYSDDSVQVKTPKGKQKEYKQVEKDKKQLPPTYPTTTRPDICPSCLDKIDSRSLDGSIASEFEYECGIEKVKRQAEDDVRCMRLLQSELEAERNAATVAANHAMNMITRLQQEKASLQMEALQYLRMMEEQAEYDMEALQKSNDLVEEKENEIQDLLSELEQYRNKYGDEPINDIKSFDEERSHILESLSKLENKINELCDGVHDKSQESENYVGLSKLEHEIMEMKEKMETWQADLDLVKHVCNTLHANEGIEFIQEIAQQLQDLRRIVFDRRLISSN